MTTTPAAAPRKPLRQWPAVVVVALQWLGHDVVPRVAPDYAAYGVMGARAGGVHLARNGEQMAAFRLARGPLTDRRSPIMEG